MEDLVSVIVPVYNSEKYLKDCVDSIVNQTYRNLDIILVNDGSTDSGGGYCDEYAKADNRVRVIHKENGGNGDARNTGLKYVRGQWIVQVDSDDMIHARQIELLLLIAAGKNADIAVGGYLPVSADEIPKDGSISKDVFDGVEILSDKHLYDDKFIKERSMILTVPWGKICRTELYTGIQYPTGGPHDDTWTTWKLYEKARRVAFTPTVLHYWRNNSNSLSRRKFDTSHFTGIDAYKEQLEYFHALGKQRYVEIAFAEYLETFFWCYNRMKESQMNLRELIPYWKYLKEHVNYIKISENVRIKQWIRYRYLMWYKIPKILGK